MAANLTAYEAKRDFTRTPEPVLEPGVALTGPLTFVVQQHAARRLHYDFRLELDGALKSWAVPKGPSVNPADKRLAVQVEDHPLAYGSFEGVIPPGEYGAGSVVVWDAGTYSPDEDGLLSFDDRPTAEQRARAGLAKGKLSITLRGTKLQGSWTLVRSRFGDKEWLLIKHDDALADSYGATPTDGRSVLTGRRVDEVAAGALDTAASLSNDRIKHTAILAEIASLPGARPAPYPADLNPMLPTLSHAAFSHPDWIFEPKLDGVRALAFVRSGAARLRGRSGIESTSQYPLLARALAAQYPFDVVFDGEIVALDNDGRPSFHRLAHRIHLQSEVDVRHAEAEIPLVYYIFDVLFLAGSDVRNVPIEARKRLLAQIGEPQPPLVLLPHFEAVGEAAYEAALAHGYEGVVAKRLGSSYESGHRSPAWLKIKGTTTDEFIIGGYSQGQGNRTDTFGALLVGQPASDGQLIYAAHVGTGFDDRTLADLLATLAPLEDGSCPFSEPPPLKGPTTWVRPELVAEIKFDQWTPEKRLRSPVFLRLRDDKSPADLLFDQCAAETDEGGPAGDALLPTGLSFVTVAVSEAQGDLDQPVDRPPADVALAITTPGGCDNDAARRQDEVKPHRSAMVEAWEPVAPVAMSGLVGVDSDLRTTVSEVLAQLREPGSKKLLEFHGVRVGLTNLDKTLWPATASCRALTKRDLITYFATVAPYLLPHLRDRPLTLIRLPNGIGGQRFYQKHSEVLPDFVEQVRHYSKTTAGDQDYLLCNNLATLLWLAQVVALELHSSYCRINPAPDAEHLTTGYAGSRENYLRSLLNFPEFIVFDLDPYIYAGHERPGEEPQLNRKAFDKCCETALWLREILDPMSLRGFLKTTGRTGLHIYVPIRRDLDYDASRALAETIAGYLAQLHPTDVTVEWSVPKRTGKIFADFNQNARAKTLASIFTPRASAEASVSTPLAWEELGHVYPTDFTILNAGERLGRVGDLWANILESKHDLRAMVGMAT